MSGTQDPRAGDRRRTVFLSYARVDQPQATRLARALTDAGLDVWWDALIEGGEAFAKTIESALDTCDAVLVVWSKASVHSDWVLDEAAKGRDLRKLVPVSLDGTPPPMGYRQYHAIDLSAWRGELPAAGMTAILRAVAAAGSGSRTVAPGAGEVRVGRAGLSRRGLLIAAGGVSLAATGGWLAWRYGAFDSRPAAAGNSVAVLPFANLSGDAGQVYFSDGLSEELRATLARNGRLQVMAQASAAVFRERKDDATTIAQKLGVAFLLDGSVRRAGDTVRVAADLIDGGTGFSRWSNVFERSMNDLFAVQTEIAGAVATELVARVGGKPSTGQGAPAATPGGTGSVAAYDAYLRGRALYDLSADQASERAALAQFDAAIAADPGYAAAHAARARSLTAIANQYGAVDELAALYEAAVASARRAIGIAPDFADAYSTLGFTLFQGRLDARAAREPFERSRELGPGEATVMARYAQYSARCGYERQASAAMQRALLLDPLNPLIHRAAASIEFAARRYDASIAPARQALKLNPRLSRAHAAIGDAFQLLGRFDEARDEYAAEPVDDFRLSGLAILEHRRGNDGAARKRLGELVSGHGDRVLYQQSQVLAQLGDRNAAVARLQQAFAAGDSGLIYLRNDPWLDPLRADPRFRQLLDRIGFV